MSRKKKVVYDTEKNCLFIPENINLLMILNNNEVKHIDKYHYFLHQLYIRRVTDTRVTKEELIPVNFDLLTQFLTTKHTKKIIDFWISMGVIETKKEVLEIVDDDFFAPIQTTIRAKRSYSSNAYSIGYRFTKNYRDIKTRKVPITDHKFATKLELKRIKSNATINLDIPAHRLLNHNLHELKIDTAAAYKIAFEANHTKQGKLLKSKVECFSRWNIAIHQIQNQRWFIHRDNTGYRVHHNWATLAKALKGTISIESGEELINADIRCSQILMLAIAVKQQYDGRDMPANVEDFIRYCEDGSFYEVFAKAANISIMDRKKFKQAFFQKVMFGRNCTTAQSFELSVFSRLFKDVAAFIYEAKRSNYKKLSHLLQRIESEIIIDGVIGGIAAEYPENQYFCLTIHDSVTVTRSNEHDIVRRIKQAFSKYGLLPTIHIETFNG